MVALDSSCRQCNYTKMVRDHLHILVLLLIFSVVSPADSQSGKVEDRLDHVIIFDIPTQSLDNALYAFDAATGVEIIVDGHLTAGLKSKTVEGLLTPAQALQILLSGTGIHAKRIGTDAITLSLNEAPLAPANSLLYRGYSAFVQSSIVRALCQYKDTRPGEYRIAVQLRLNSAGVISDVNLLSSTGNPRRDVRLHEILSGLSVGALPPPTLPQPIIMVILPRSAQASGDCI